MADIWVPLRVQAPKFMLASPQLQHMGTYFRICRIDCFIVSGHAKHQSLFSRFADISCKRLKTINMDGFGNARTEVINVFISRFCCLCSRQTLWSSATSFFLRHALPPGFVLKKDKKKMDEQIETISLEDLIEKEVCLRHSPLHICSLSTYHILEKCLGRKLDESNAGDIQSVESQEGKVTWLVGIIVEIILRICRGKSGSRNLRKIRRGRRTNFKPVG